MSNSVTRLRFPVLLMASIFLFACASTTPTTEQELPAVTEDGLKRVPSNAVDAAYRKEGASLASYTAVHIGECKVSLKKNWMREQNMEPTRRDGTAVGCGSHRERNVR